MLKLISGILKKKKTIGDKVSDGNVFGGIMQPSCLEPDASNLDENGDYGSVREDENDSHTFTIDWWVLFFCSIDDL